MKGCKCKTGCTTGRCGCWKKGQNCSEGCSYLHCSNLSNISGKEKSTLQDTAELETEQNSRQSHTSNVDSEMQYILEFLLAPTSDSESESVSEAGSESNGGNEMLSD